MLSGLRHFALGDTLTGSPHSVCVSLPTLADVIGYEEKDPRVLAALTSGYPRFLPHPFLRQAAAAVAGSAGVPPHTVFLAAGPAAAEALCAFLPPGAARLLPDPELAPVAVADHPEPLQWARHFLQHTGLAPSSREMEDWLVAHGRRSAPHPEDTCPGEADAVVRAALHSLYGTADPEDIVLCRGGMNAFFAAFTAARAVQEQAGRNVWVQLGWLYLDTARVMEKFGPAGGEVIAWYDLSDLSGLAERLEGCRGRVAGIVTEVPTNPLVQTCDLARLRQLADRHQALLVLDPTVASPHNVQVLPWCDLHVNSLTKYAAAAGDVMLGAVAFNRRSPAYPALRAAFGPGRAAPGPRDLARLAAQIPGYGPTVAAINRNASAAAEFLARHPGVSRLDWAGAGGGAGDSYRAVLRPGGGPGGILSFTTRQPLARFYDRVRIAKSPSFGLGFSLLCPFLYLAHYDLVSRPEGRAFLQSAGLPPDLVRLSVGTEPVEDLLAALDEALR